MRGTARVGRATALIVVQSINVKKCVFKALGIPRRQVHDHGEACVAFTPDYIAFQYGLMIYNENTV